MHKETGKVTKDVRGYTCEVCGFQEKVDVVNDNMINYLASTSGALNLRRRKKKIKKYDNNAMTARTET